MTDSALHDIIHRLRTERDALLAGDMVAVPREQLVALREAITGTGKWGPEANRAVRTLADLAPVAPVSGRSES